MKKNNRVILSSVIIVILFSFHSTAQDRNFLGWQPTFLLQKKFDEKTNLFLQFNTELNLLEKKYANRNFPSEVTLMDIRPGFSTDLNPNLNIAGCFVFRLRRPFSEDVTTELRPWQQLTFIHRINKYRVRNRLRTEQRWIRRNESKPYEFDLRTRYRLSIDFPLQGERLDNKEFYLNSSYELLVTPTIDDAFFFRNNRTYVGIGNKINDKNKLEFGLEWQHENLNKEGNIENTFFIRTVWVVKI